MNTPDMTNHELEISVKPDPEAREPGFPADLMFADAEAFIELMDEMHSAMPRKHAH